MSKSKVYNIDLWEENPLTVPTIQLDSDRTIRFKITANKEDYDLSFKSVRYFIQKEDGKIVFNDCDIVDGIVEAKLTNQALYYTGTVPMQLLIYSPTGVEKTFVIYVYISESIVNDLAEESKNEINVFQDVYKAIETLDKKIFDINDEVVKLADHNHDTLYAGISHNHNEYSEINHTHNEYAEAKHNHNEYAEVKHTHNEYAEVKHNHSEYAEVKHNHNEYAEVKHKHSEYAPIDHTHENMGGSATTTVIDSNIPDGTSGLTNLSYKFVLTEDIIIAPNETKFLPLHRAKFGVFGNAKFVNGVDTTEYTEYSFPSGRYLVGFRCLTSSPEAFEGVLNLAYNTFHKASDTSTKVTMVSYNGPFNLKNSINILNSKETRKLLKIINRDSKTLIIKKDSYLLIEDFKNVTTAHTHSEYVNSRILSAAEYEALTTEEKNNGVMYFVY